MSRFILSASRATSLAIVIGVVVATAPRASAAPADFHHVHLNVTDPAKAAKWYADNMEGEAKKAGGFHATGFGKTLILFYKAKAGFPESKGSSVEHVGFSYPDIHAKMKELADNGVEIVSGIEQEGPIKYAFVKDPWGTLIEVVEDPDLIGFHHIHLAVTDPKSALGWYTRAFGGEITLFAGILLGIRYGDMWVLVKKVRQPQAPTQGRAIDHISWALPDLDETADELRANGVEFESKPFVLGTSKIAFVVDPTGVRIELVAPAKPDAHR